MKRVIDYKTYDEELDKKLWTRTNGLKYGDFYHYEENLYVNRCGDYFLYLEGGHDSPCHFAWGSQAEGYGRVIKPLTVDEAMDWAREAMPEEEYLKLFA